MPLYGIESLADSVAECRTSLLDEFGRSIGLALDDALFAAARYVLDVNIVHGDALSMMTEQFSPRPITSAEWSDLGKGRYHRRIRRARRPHPAAASRLPRLMEAAAIGPVSTPGTSTVCRVEETGNDTTRARAAKVRPLIETHLGLVATGGAALLVGIRLLRVAHGEPNATFSILQSTGSGTVLTSILVEVIPVAAVGFWSYAIGRLPRWWLADNLDRHVLYLLGLTATALFLTLWSALLLGILLAIQVIVIVWRRRRSSTERAGLPSDAIIFLVGIMILLLFILPDRMWLPSEVVTIDGQAPITVYVLSESDDEVRLLRDDNRDILVVDVSDLGGRSLCANRDVWQRPLMSLGDPPTDYPQCPGW